MGSHGARKWAKRVTLMDGCQCRNLSIQVEPYTPELNIGASRISYLYYFGGLLNLIIVYPTHPILIIKAPILRSPELRLKEVPKSSELAASTSRGSAQQVCNAPTIGA